MGGDFAFLLPVMMMTVGCAFLVLERCGLRAALPWGIGFAFSAIGFTVPVWPAFVPGIACGIAADTLFATAFFAYGRGVARHEDRGIVLRVRQAALLAAVGLAVLTVPMGDLRIDAASNDLCCAVLLGTALIPKWRRRKSPAGWALAIVATLVEVETLLRGGTAFLTAVPGTTGGFLGTTYAFLMQAGAGVLGLFLALAALGSILFDATATYRRDAQVDPLSGLLNRRGFADAVRALPRRVRQGGAVIACDIDHFKRVNDRYGHPAGDAVIAGFADLIRRNIPARAIARRSGGEEFTIFLPGSDGAEATRIANAVRAQFALSDWQAHGIGDRLTASFGVALTDADIDADLEACIARADEALYDAKGNGRDRVFYRLEVVASNSVASPAPPVLAING